MSVDPTRYSDATRRVQPSAIRELFALLSKPGIVSLAGGFPSAAGLDIEGLREATKRATVLSSTDAFQYGSSEGYLPLRELIVQRASERGTRLAAADTVITTGSQQALDLVTRVLVNPGDRVLVEASTFPGALQAFRFQGAALSAVQTNDAGMQDLEALIIAQRPKLFYLIPNFANPSGATMSLRRRKHILSLAKTHRFHVVEDDAYGELYFNEPPPPSLFALATEEEREWVVHISSFSKILAPGLRLAWMSAPAELLRHIVVAKQLSDVHAPTFAQLVAFHYLHAGSLEPALCRIRQHYRSQALAMGRSIKAELGDTPFIADEPEGGMFYWARMPGVDTSALLEHAVAHGVAYVPGAPFYAGEADTSRLRLSFSTATPEQIGEGIRRLARSVHHMNVPAPGA